MEPHSQYKDFPHHISFIPLSLGGVCQDREEEVPRKVTRIMTSQSRDCIMASGTHEPGMTWNSGKERVLFDDLEYFKGSLGKRRISSHRVGGDVPLKDNLELGLGLGSSPSFHDGGCSSEIGICSGASYSQSRIPDPELMDLDLGLTYSFGLELTNDCLNSSRMLCSNVTSVGQASHFLESEACLDARCETGLHRSTHSQVRNPHGCFQDPKYVSGTIDSASLMSASGENTCGMDLELGLSAALHSADSDCVPYFIGTGRGAQECGRDAMAGECNPLIDEGSTSARWMKSRGYIASILHCGRSTLNQTDSLCPTVLLQEDASKIDISVGKKTVTHSGTARETCTQLSGQMSRMTGSESSVGALARSSDRASKMCKFKGCGKGARGASGLCIAHGGGRRCQRPNCNKGAEGRTMYCKAHGGGRRCQRLGCIKSAEGKTDFCIGHGGGRRCNTEGCNKAARGKSGLCIRHGGGKRCQKEGCTKSAEGYAGLCISHGGGRRCQYLGCGKGAQGSTMYCKAHGGGRRCEFEGCTKGAEGSTPHCKAHGGGKRCMFGGGTCTKSVHGGTLFCVAHGGGKRCAVPGCTKSARGRTDHCVRHGGGKRCKFENCSKSAQGSTDFCKAHGGGKKCSWCQEGSTYSEEIMNDTGVDLKKPCDRFARGKTGLCAAHNALVQRLRVPWDGTSGSSYSRGIIPDGGNDSVSRSIHNEHSLPSYSDSSEHNSQYSSDHDEPPSGTAESHARANFEGPCKQSCSYAENESCQAKQCRRGITSDGLLQDVSVHGRYMDILPLHREDSSNCFFSPLSTSNAGGAIKRHPNDGPNNNILPELSSFSSTQVAFSSGMSKEDQFLHDDMQRLRHSFSLSASDNASSMLSLSFSEERVHGGGLMALLAKEAARHGGIQ